MEFRIGFANFSQQQTGHLEMGQVKQLMGPLALVAVLRCCQAAQAAGKRLLNCCTCFGLASTIQNR